MRRIAFLVIAILTMAALSCWLLHAGSAIRPDAPGVLIADPSQLTLTRQNGASQIVTVSLRNRGGRPVQIRHISAPCGCTIIEPLEVNELSPDCSTVLVVRVTLPVYGRKSVVLRVTTDRGTADPEILLTLIGEQLAAPYVHSSPSRIDLLGYAPGAAISKEIVVVTVEDTASGSWLTALTDSHSLVQTEMIDGPQETKFTGVALRSYRFKVSTRLPDAKTERVRSYLSFDTPTAPTRVATPIVVEARCLKPIQVVPDVVFIAADELSLVSVDRLLLLRAGDDSEWTITGLGTTHPCLTACIESQPAGRKLGRIKIKIQAKTPLDEHTAEKAVLTIETTHPLQPIIKVPVIMPNRSLDDDVATGRPI